MYVRICDLCTQQSVAVVLFLAIVDGGAQPLEHVVEDEHGRLEVAALLQHRLADTEGQQLVRQTVKQLCACTCACMCMCMCCAEVEITA